MRHAIFGEKVSRVTSDIPSAIYTIPEIAMIGKTAEELKNDGLPFETGICHFKDLAKGLILGETEGILKILFNKKTGKILGIHLMGHLSSELIHIGQAVMELAGTIYYFMEKVMNFPTLASAYKVAARNGLSSGGEKKSKIPDKG
jgi:NAD(P) transhydrogenase